MGTINGVGVWVIKKKLCYGLVADIGFFSSDLCANEIQLQLLIADRTRNAENAAQLLSCVWELNVSLKVVCIGNLTIFTYSQLKSYSRVCFTFTPAWPSEKYSVVSSVISTTHACIFLRYLKNIFHSKWLEHITNWTECSFCLSSYVYERVEID